VRNISQGIECAKILVQRYCHSGEELTSLCLYCGMLQVNAGCVRHLADLIYMARCLLEALLSGLPVDDVPDGLEILSLAVLVVKVVGTKWG
jgi:hypothetical protein